jgi:hypothetical protein
MWKIRWVSFREDLMVYASGSCHVGSFFPDIQRLHRKAALTFIHVAFTFARVDG